MFEWAKWTVEDFIVSGSMIINVLLVLANVWLLRKRKRLKKDDRYI